MADDFYSFDEALNELKLKEEELKRLVSEGEIRAFRKGDTMKLRRKDVEELRAELDSDIVELGDTVDELVFEDDGDAGMATQELDVETLVDEPVEELEPAPAAAPPPRAASRSSRSARGAAEPAAAPVRRQSAIAAAKEDEEEEPGWVKGLLILTTVVLFLAAPMITSLLTGRASGFAKGIAGALGNQFAADGSQAAETPADAE